MKVTSFIAGLILIAVISPARAAISYTTSGNVVNENFDSLDSSGTNGIAWANDSTLPGWSLFNSTGAAVPTYNSNNGGTNAGAFYSFGTTGSGERALGGTASGGAYFGSPPSGALAGWITVAINNNTGGALTDFTVGFDGEQWRNGGNATAQTMVLEYGFGPSFGTVGSWTAPGGNFDWTSVVNTTTAAAVDGNVAGLVPGRGGSVGGQTWNNGDTLWIRWIENNDVGNDHGLGIDNFSFSATPEPATIGLLAIGALAMNRRRR